MSVASARARASDSDFAPESCSDRFAGANCLAPMVRVGTLPMRLLAREYGAHLVYTEVRRQRAAAVA